MATKRLFLSYKSKNTNFYIENTSPEDISISQQLGPDLDE
jgi:hypothetical protein